MEEKLSITIKGGGTYFRELTLNHLFYIAANKLPKNSYDLSTTSTEVAFEISTAIPIIVPKFDKTSVKAGDDDIEIIIKHSQEFGPQELKNECIQRYGSFIHHMMKGIPDYIDSKILLNVDNDTIYLIFGNESDYIPEIYLLNMHKDETIEGLLEGFKLSGIGGDKSHDKV